MKNIFFLLALFSLTHANAQIVPSSCSASDSIIALYEDDADRLALRRIFTISSAFVDSVYIPQVCSDTVLNSLIAVYNAISLPARDTVTSIFDIHTLTDIGMDRLAVHADSSLSWMQQLRLSNIPTGDASFDSLIYDYNLNFDQYYACPPNFGYHSVSFNLDSNHNIYALGNLFEALPGVYSTDDNYFTLDGNNITSIVYPTHIELLYSHGWDDCWNGCISRRFWKFNVYYDCSVEYLGSYGDPLHPLIGIEENEGFNVSIYPNPISEIFTIEISSLPQEKKDLSIYNVLGKKVLQENFSSQNYSVDASGFSSGV